MACATKEPACVTVTVVRGHTQGGQGCVFFGVEGTRRNCLVCRPTRAGWHGPSCSSKSGCVNSCTDHGTCKNNVCVCDYGASRSPTRGVVSPAVHGAWDMSHVTRRGLLARCIRTGRSLMWCRTTPIRPTRAQPQVGTVPGAISQTPFFWVPLACSPSTSRTLPTARSYS